jgi:LPXTG-motif cell wall-anchored protein
MADAVPQTGAYMTAAYLVAAAILLGYAIVLARRARRS